MKNLKLFLIPFMLLFVAVTASFAQNGANRTLVNPSEQIRAGAENEILQVIGGKPTWQPAANIADGDGDSSNEIQDIVDNGDGTYGLSGGGSGSINVNDADSDTTNEIQDIVDNGDGTYGLSGGGAGSINVNDADSDVTNEIQTLSASGQTGTLSNSGGTLTLVQQVEEFTGLSGTSVTATGSLPTADAEIIVKVNGLPETVGTGQPFVRSGATFTYFRTFESWEKVTLVYQTLQ